MPVVERSVGPVLIGEFIRKLVDMGSSPESIIMDRLNFTKLNTVPLPAETIYTRYKNDRMKEFIRTINPRRNCLTNLRDYSLEFMNALSHLEILKGYSVVSSVNNDPSFFSNSDKVFLVNSEKPNPIKYNIFRIRISGLGDIVVGDTLSYNPVIPNLIMFYWNANIKLLPIGVTLIINGNKLEFYINDSGMNKPILTIESYINFGLIQDKLIGLGLTRPINGDDITSLMRTFKYNDLVVS